MTKRYTLGQKITSAEFESLPSGLVFVDPVEDMPYMVTEIHDLASEFGQVYFEDAPEGEEFVVVFVPLEGRNV